MEERLGYKTLVSGAVCKRLQRSNFYRLQLISISICFKMKHEMFQITLHSSDKLHFGIWKNNP